MKAIKSCKVFNAYELHDEFKFSLKLIMYCAVYEYISEIQSAIYLYIRSKGNVTKKQIIEYCETINITKKSVIANYNFLLKKGFLKQENECFTLQYNYL